MVSSWDSRIGIQHQLGFNNFTWNVNIAFSDLWRQRWGHHVVVPRIGLYPTRILIITIYSKNLNWIAIAFIWKDRAVCSITRRVADCDVIITSLSRAHHWSVKNSNKILWGWQRFFSYNLNANSIVMKTEIKRPI